MPLALPLPQMVNNHNYEKKQLIMSPKNNISQKICPVSKYVTCSSFKDKKDTTWKRSKIPPLPTQKKDNRKNKSNLSWYNHKDNKYTGWAAKETAPAVLLVFFDVQN